MKRAFTIVYIVLFCIVLLIPAFMWLSGIKEGRKFFDNRKPAELPEFNINRLDPYPMKFDSFFNDHFPLRNTSIYSLNYMDAHYFGKSPKPDMVTVGTDGWLFPGGPELQFVLGQQPLSDTMVSMMIAELNERHEFCKANGAEFRLVVVPAKTTLYPEYLPMHYQLGNWISPMEVFMKRATKESKAPILYLLDSLVAQKATHQLYLKADTHWNDEGTYFGYRAIMNWMYPGDQRKKLYQTDFVPIDQWVQAGNFSDMLGMGDYWNDTIRTLAYPGSAVVHPRDKENYPCDSSWFSYCVDYEIAWQNADTTLPGLLVIRDSFTNQMMQHLLGSHFGRSTFIWDYWQHKLNKEIFLKEKPKVVLCIMNERFLLNLAKYPNKEEKGGANFLRTKYW